MTVNILALDSASNVCGVSLLSAGEKTVVKSACYSGSSQHAEHILPLIEQVQKDSEVENQAIHAVAFAQGPGGFTGLRVACGVAQGIAYALGLRIAAISSLLAIAAQQQPVDQNTIELVLVDARMKELYVGAYQRTATGWYSLHKPILMGAAQLHHYIVFLQNQQKELDLGSQLRVSGDALVAIDGLKTELAAYSVLFGNTDLARSETIAQLGLLAYEEGRLIEPALAAPLYIRNRVAYTIAERDQGAGGNPVASWQSVTIQAMDRTHLNQVVQLEQLLQPQPWGQSQFQSSLEAGHWAWVAMHEGQPVAYAVLMPAVDECELLLIGVAPTSQRQGIAQQLLCYAEQHARSQGILKVHLEVRASNTAAIELYQGAGYEPVGLRKNYYLSTEQQREDALLYTKTLA